MQNSTLAKANALFRAGDYQEAYNLYKIFLKNTPAMASAIKYNIWACKKRLGNQKLNYEFYSDQPCISVIIPIHNVQEYLDKCLNSILNQSLRNIEVILVDDASTDSSATIINHYSIKDKRIVVIQNSVGSGNSGTPRNQALERATGEYIAFVDSDDWIEPEMLHTLYWKAKFHDCDIVSSGGFYRELPNDKNKIVNVSNNSFDPKKNEMRANLYLNPSFPVVWYRIYRTTFVARHKIKFGETTTSADLPFAFKALFLANKVVSTEDIYYHYRFDRPFSTIDRRKGRGAFELFKAYENLLHFLKSKNAQEEYMPYLILKALGDYTYNCKFLNEELKPEFRAKMSDFIVTHRKSIKNLNIFNNHWRGLLDSFLNDRCNTVPTLQTNECDGMAGNNFKSPSISVIVPAYNVEKYIGRCLDSLIAQTLRNIEIIVINDGSSDSTVSILKNYMKRDKRIVLINCSIASGNAGTPRNIGICKAKGDYIGFVDSDDWVESNMFEKLYEKTLDTDVDIVSTSSFFKHKREEKMVIRLNYIKINREKSNNKDSFKSAYFSNIWNRIYKRELVEKHNIYFPRIYFAEDLCFSTACHIFARSTEIVEGAYYHYNYDRPESTTSLRKGEKGFQVISNFQTMRNYFDHLAIYDEFCAQILQKKFNSLWYTYDRLHDEIKPQFFNEMCRLYNDVKHNIDLSLFTPDLEKRMALLSPTNSCPTAVDIRKSKNLTNQAI